MDEIRAAILRTKALQSTGMSGVPVAALKQAPEHAAALIHRVAVALWRGADTPQQWRDSVVTPLYKAGDRHDAANYRRIAVTDADSKAYRLWLVQSPWTKMQFAYLTRYCWPAAETILSL